MLRRPFCWPAEESTLESPRGCTGRSVGEILAIWCRTRRRWSVTVGGSPPVTGPAWLDADALLNCVRVPQFLRWSRCVAL